MVISCIAPRAVVCKPLACDTLYVAEDENPHFTQFIFGRPFVKRFDLCYQTVVCMSVCNLAMKVSTKFEADTTIRCLVIALLLLIRYVTLTF